MTRAAAPFDGVAASYDAAFSGSRVGLAQRRAVLEIADRVFAPGDRLLEINCGTGVDAFHFASRGIVLLATDASEAMIEQARKRCCGLPGVRFQVCAIENLAAIRAVFDGVFSNFAGLNCVASLESVAEDMARLVRPGGRALLCLFGSFCLWELAWYLPQLRLHKAFRRLRGSGVARMGASAVTVRYWRVAELQRACLPWFELVDRYGVGILVPPSYAESLAQRWPGLLRRAETLDRRLSNVRGARNLADHVVVELRRTGVRVAR